MIKKQKLDPRSEMGKLIIRSLADGYDSKQIADQTNMTKLTVDAYRGRLLQTAGVKNTAELVAYGYRQGILVDGEPARLVRRCLSIINGVYEPRNPEQVTERDSILEELQTYLANG